jgi:isocitrate dehydrogenase
VDSQNLSSHASYATKASGKRKINPSSRVLCFSHILLKVAWFAKKDTVATHKRGGVTYMLKNTMIRLNDKGAETMPGNQNTRLAGADGIH